MLDEESEEAPASISARADKGHGDKYGHQMHGETGLSRVQKGRRRSSASRRRSGGSTAAAVGGGVVVGAAVGSSYSSRRRSQRLVEYWDCDSRGTPQICEYGCENGYCTIPPADQICGTTWAPVAARTATCPSVTWNSWKSIMESPTIIENNLDGVHSDSTWFQGLMETYLYAPIENTTNVTTSAGGDVFVTLPPTLEVLSQQNQPEYNLFTCSRRLPKCVNDNPEPSECIQRCHAISDKIAEFTEACVALADVADAAARAAAPICDRDPATPSGLDDPAACPVGCVLSEVCEFADRVTFTGCPAGCVTDLTAGLESCTGIPTAATCTGEAEAEQTPFECCEPNTHAHTHARARAHLSPSLFLGLSLSLFSHTSVSLEPLLLATTC